jgi:Domain of unknown function (DUF397)
LVLLARTVTAQRKEDQVKNPPSCSSGACVDVTTTPDGVALTSTIDGNNGRVTYTADEWSTFMADVKSGAWDHTLDQATASV